MIQLKTSTEISQQIRYIFEVKKIKSFGTFED